MEPQNAARSSIEKIGFELLDFIGYFIPGAVFLYGMLFIHEFYAWYEYRMIVASEMTNRNIEWLKSSLVTEMNAGGVVIMIISAYLIGNIFVAIKWLIIDAYTKCKLGVKLDIAPYVRYYNIEKRDVTKELIEDYERRNIEAHSKYIRLHPGYYGYNRRMHAIASLRMNTTIGIIILAIINYVSFCSSSFYYWPWVIRTNVIMLMLSGLLIWDSKSIQNNYFKRIMQVGEIEEE